MKFMKVRSIPKLLISCLITLLLLALSSLVPSDRAFGLTNEENTAKLIEGAKKEGRVLWYVVFSLQDAQPIMTAFEKKYPFIKGEIYRLGEGKMLLRILSEARANKHLFDVTGFGTFEFEILRKKGLIGKYLSPQRRFYPEGDKDQEGYWTGIYANKEVIVYNTKMVPPKDVPKTYEDLLNSRWKGKMAMESANYYWFAALMKMMGEEKGLEYMKKLGEQNIQFRTGRTLICQLVSAGELTMGLGLHNSSPEELKGKGAPIDWVAIEPVIGKTHPTGISAHAAHPNAAKLFIDFILSKEAQEIVARSYRIPTRIGVEAIVPKLKLEDKKIFPPDVSMTEEEFDRYIKLYQKILMKK